MGIRMDVGHHGGVWSASIIDENLDTTIMQVMNQPTEEHARAVGQWIMDNITRDIAAFAQALYTPYIYLGPNGANSRNEAER